MGDQAGGDFRDEQSAPPRRLRSWLVGAAVVVGLFALGAVAVLALSHFMNTDAGTVKFGTSYADDGSKFTLQNSKSTFKRSEHVAWVGYLSHNVDAKSLRRTIARVNGNGSLTVLLNLPVRLSSSTSNKVDEVAADSTVAALEELGVNPPGTYEIRYLSNGQTEAKGRFTLAGPSPTGRIFFGTAATDSMIAGVRGKASFTRAETMNYAVHFARPQGPGRLQVKIFRVKSDGSEQQVSQGLYDDLKSRGLWVRVNQVAVRDMPGYGARTSGTYILGYYDRKRLLAEGAFSLHL